MTPLVMLFKSGRPVDKTTDVRKAVKSVGGLRGGFVWVDLRSPSPQQLELVLQQVGMQELSVAHLTGDWARHAIDQVGDVHVIAFKALERHTEDEEPQLSAAQVVACVSKNVVLTIHDGVKPLFAQVRDCLKAAPKFLAHGPFAVVRVVCDEVVAEYDRIAHIIESDIIDVEHEVFDLHTPDPIDDIYTLKREVLFFRRVEDPLHPVLADLARGRVSTVPKALREKFQQTLQELDRVDKTIDTLNELVTNILQSHLAQVAVQQNTDMRRISSWAAIIAVPTMIAGLYGMNFTHMPELTWAFGYPAAAALMVVCCFVVFRILKKSGWL